MINTGSGYLYCCLFYDAQISEEQVFSFFFTLSTHLRMILQALLLPLPIYTFSSQVQDEIGTKKCCSLLLSIEKRAKSGKNSIESCNNMPLGCQQATQNISEKANNF